MPPMTEWLPVVGFEDRYRISDDGEVYSVRKGGLIYQHTLNGGHKLVKLFRGDRGNLGHSRLVHALVLEAFTTPCPPGQECLHENDIASDNRLENLRWGTRLENINDSLRNGKHWSSQITHCPRGHEYTPENTYIPPTPKGGRNCIACTKERSQQKRKTKKDHCRKGHPYTPENTYLRTTENGTRRICRICKREQSRAWSSKLRAKK